MSLNNESAEVGGAAGSVGGKRLRVLTVLRGALLASLVAVIFTACSRQPVKEQPLRYSHKAHVSNGLPCELCHETAATQAFAGIPSVETCMTCHQGKITDSPEEEKLRKIAASGGVLDWQPIFELPTHTYFSHRRHVTLGDIKCRTCHGDLEDTTVLPDSPPINVNMDFCIRCHEEREASVDCISCHQ